MIFKKHLHVLKKAVADRSSPVLQEIGLKVHMVPLGPTAFAQDTRESTQRKTKIKDRITHYQFRII